jgi:choline transport protein
MADSKHETQAVAQARDSESQHDDVATEKKGTAGDQKDMYRMGKQQELRRNFRFVSIFGYSMVLMATWETILTLVHSSLCTGGKATDF